MWVPVTNTTKPNETLGNHVIISTGGAAPIPTATTSAANSDSAYKEKYGSMKAKLKDILYENELFQDELKTLQRELLDIYRDKEALLQKVLQFEECPGSSDESDVEIPSDKSNQEKVLAIETRTEYKAQDIGPVCQESLKRKVESDGINNKKICINLKHMEPKSELIEVTSHSKPKTAGSRSRKAIPKAASATITNSGSDSKIDPSDPPINNKPPPKKSANNKNAKSDGTESQKPAPVKRERKRPQPKEPKEIKEPRQPKQPKQPKKQTSKQQQQQQAPKALQTTTTSQPVTFVHQVGQQQVHLVSPENRLQEQSQQFKMEPQQPQHQQQQPITVQLGPMSMPTEPIKYIQHVNLPVQNLDSNSMIVTNNTNQIQLQQQQQNHLMTQQPQQIHFQLPQTTLAPVIDAFQTPQSMITTQGNQITFNGQSYTIVSTTSDGTSTLLQHDQIQSQQHQQLNHYSSSPEQHQQLNQYSSSPEQQQQLNHYSSSPEQQQQQQIMTQVLPMNTINHQKVNSISPQSVQNHSPEQDQHHQQINHQTPQLQHQQHYQPSHDNSQYQHSIVQFRANQANHMQINHHQLQEENVCADVDFEHHLDTRRIEDAALLEDWQTGDLFDNYLVGDKFMVED